mmetsp:Transcript_31410/g.91750  ORF Transcript_31410/g.91750 Transcript_31410/m.91750 type:complete len:122 (+) Transcript_31410:1942-2307(+)
MVLVICMGAVLLAATTTAEERAVPGSIGRHVELSVRAGAAGIGDGDIVGGARPKIGSTNLRSETSEFTSGQVIMFGNSIGAASSSIQLAETAFGSECFARVLKAPSAKESTLWEGKLLYPG